MLRNNVHPHRPSLQSLRSFGNLSTTDCTATRLHRPSHHGGYVLLRRAYLQVGPIFAWLLAPTSLPDDHLKSAATVNDQRAGRRKHHKTGEGHPRPPASSEPDARHFPSDDYVADQSTLFGPRGADAHSMNIAPWGFQIRLRCSAAQRSQRLLPGFQGKGVFSDAIGRDDPVAIPSSGVRSAELVMGSRGLYRHDYRPWEESPGLLRTRHLQSADGGHPGSVV
ncbi:hypothetical protein B0T18DRAFT_108062 [Schizothecium vesticola]|uniref:Uncharacterized protein n=1 Tax=Schizothecium vesticola TaxID=314040 RepID=A0AA40F1J6_9PEZI|nr:hypothetical protein B0T18DRAFT_108062 [Schizothecium vesticola]